MAADVQTGWFMARRRMAFVGVMACLTIACLAWGVGACGSGGGAAPVIPAPPAAPVVLIGALPSAIHTATTIEFPTPVVTSGAVDSFSVSPPLPSGFVVNPTTGAIIGSPAAASPATSYTLTATYGTNSGHPSAPFSVTVATFTFQVDDFPHGVELAADGFYVEKLHSGLDVPVRMAQAPLPDGRVFYAELGTGSIRTLNADLSLNPTVWATVPVATGGERGLIGLALSPNFLTDGFVYVVACVDVPDNRNQVIRLTENTQTKLGGSATIIVDNLPQGAIGNGGEILFLADGTFLLSIGDNGNENLAQDDQSLAGRVLRYNADGTIPADNPNPASPEYVRGLRNSFGMTRNPLTGGVFATENGPAADDELNFIQPGRNFNWPAEPVGLPAAQFGLTLRRWNEVIAPTGIVFARDPAFGSSQVYPSTEYALLIGAYVEAEVVRLVMSGAAYADIDSEDILIRFENVGVSNKPLDLIELHDFSVLVSTFEGIWRLRKP